MAEQVTDQQPNVDIPPAVQPPRHQIQIDDSKVIASYSDFCRVTGTPEELIIDFGLNPQPFGVPTEQPLAIFDMRRLAGGLLLQFLP